MECPHKDSEDTPNENFAEYDSGCKNCRHYEECSERNCMGDNHPVFSASTRNKLHNKFSEFYDPKRRAKGKFLKEDILNFVIDLETLNIWDELSKFPLGGTIKRKEQ